MARDNKTKIKELREAVLSGSVEQVEDLFAKSGPYPFTAEALGLATRYCGVPMVETLLDHGATFEYTPTSSLRRNTDDRVGIVGRGHVDFRACLFPTLDPSVRESPEELRWRTRYHAVPSEPAVLYPVLPYSGKPAISAQERLRVMELLTERNIPGLHGFLYFAILADDSEIYNYLVSHRVTELPAPYTGLLRGLIPANEFASLGMHAPQDLLQATLKKYNDETIVQVLARFREALPGKLSIFRYETLPVERVFSDSKLFIFCADHTDLKEELRRMDVAQMLIEQNNSSGLAHILKENWFNTRQMRELLNTLNTTENEVSAEPSVLLLAALGDKQGAGTNSLRSLSLSPKAGMAAMRHMWSFRDMAGGLEIYSYKGPGEDMAPIMDLVIPDMIGKKPVVGIARQTFEERYTKDRITDARNSLASIQFPGSILELRPVKEQKTRYDHFKFVPSVQRIVISEGTQSIGPGAFEFCKTLTAVEFPSTLRKIDANAFSDCEALAQINLPDGLREIGARAFRRTALTELICPPDLRTIDEEAFSGNGFGCYQRSIAHLQTVQLNEGLKEIGSNAFRKSEITHLVIPASVRKIGKHAFADSPLLKTVKLLGMDTEVDNTAFYNCPRLVKIEMPDGTI